MRLHKGQVAKEFLRSSPVLKNTVKQGKVDF